MIVVKAHEKCVNVVCFSPDGTRLASGYDDCSVKVWEPTTLHTGRPLWELDAEACDVEFDDGFFEPLPVSGVTGAGFTADGKVLVTTGHQMHVQAWDTRDGRHTWDVTKPLGATGVTSLAVAPDGKHIAFAGGTRGVDERVFITDTKARKRVWSVSGHERACGTLAAGPDGFVSSGADKHLRFWKWAGGPCYHEFGLSGTVRALAFAPDGSRLAACVGPVVTVWEMPPPVRAGARPRPGVSRRLRGHKGPVRGIDFAPDGRSLASAGDDGTMRVWDAATGAEVRAFDPQLGPLRAVAFAPDGLTLAFSSQMGHIGLLDLEA